MKGLEIQAQGQQLEELKAELADVQNARARQDAHEKATGKTDFNLYLLAYLYTGGFFASIIVMVFVVGLGYFPKDIPQAAVFLLGNLFGALTAGSGAVVQYFFGSSKGSADKSMAMERTSQALVDVAAKSRK